MNFELNTNISPDQKLYKILVNGKSCHGGDMLWSLPTANGPGNWHAIEDNPQLCIKGFHLTQNVLEWYKKGCDVYEAEIAEYASLTKYDANDHKIAVNKCRLVRKLSDAELNDLGIVRAGFFRDVLRDQTVILDGGTIFNCYGTVKLMYDGVIERFVSNAHINLMYGGVINIFYNGVVDGCYGGTIDLMYQGFFRVMRGGIIKRLVGGTINAVRNATIEEMDGNYATAIVYEGDLPPSVKGAAVVIDRRKFRAPEIILGD